MSKRLKGAGDSLDWLYDAERDLSAATATTGLGICLLAAGLSAVVDGVTGALPLWGVLALLIMVAVPFSAVGAIWFLYFLGYNMSIGVWVGLIALLGVDAETAIFMLLYLNIAYEGAKKEGKMNSLADLQNAIHDGAVKRIRPKFMTVAVMFMGLVPIMWSTGAGADVMRRIAAPMIGGIFTSFILELVVYPAIYEVWKWNTEVKKLVAS